MKQKPANHAGSQSPGRQRIKRFVRSSTLFVGLAAILLAGTLISDEFLTIDNQRDVLWQVSNNGIIAIGMTLVILTAGIDLSVGSLMSLCTVVCAMLLMERQWTKASGFAVPALGLTGAVVSGAAVAMVLSARSVRKLPRILASVLTAAAVGAVLIWWSASQVHNGFTVLGVLLAVPPVGMVMGAISGLIIAKGRLQPFIVTLAMMISAVGLAKWIAGQGGAIHPIYYHSSDPSVPIATRDFELLSANIRFAGKELLPVPGIFFVVCAVLAWVVLAKLRFGRYIYAVGGNEQTARLSGINTSRVKVVVYAISGLLAGLAVVLYCAQYTQGKADAGEMKELDAIAAVVIGGTSLMGGRGRIIGTVIGVLIFGYLSNILNLKGVKSEIQDVLKGVIIVAAVLLQEGILIQWLSQLRQAVRKFRLR